MTSRTDEMYSEHNQIERLYRQHGPALLLFAIAMTGERSRAQDALHQVFAKLLERADLDEVLDTKAYLFQSVRNAVLNDSRASARTVSLDEGEAWFDVLNRDHRRSEFAARIKRATQRPAAGHNFAHLVRLYQRGDRRTLDYQPEYGGVAIPLRIGQAARGYGCEGGFLCRCMLMTSNLKFI